MKSLGKGEVYSQNQQHTPSVVAKSGLTGGIIFGALMEVTRIAHLGFNNQPLSLRLEMGHSILALVSGVFSALIFAFFLDWFYEKLPTKHAVTKSMILMLVTYLLFEGSSLEIYRPANPTAIGVFAPIPIYMLVAALFGIIYVRFAKLGRSSTVVKRSNELPDEIVSERLKPKKKIVCELLVGVGTIAASFLYLELSPFSTSVYLLYASLAMIIVGGVIAFHAIHLLNRHLARLG